MTKNSKSSSSANTTKKVVKSNKSDEKEEEIPMKFQDLKLNRTYNVIEFSKPINSKFGTSYILKVTKMGSTDQFKVWSSPVLAKYITKEKPKEKITFTIKYNNKNERNIQK